MIVGAVPIHAEKRCGIDSALAEKLQGAVRGDVRFDALSRTLYATDASMYEITPAGVVLPRDEDDVSTVVQHCHDHDTPVVARGAGTGLTGGAVGWGVQVDLSRHMNRIIRLDTESRRVEVEAGVVLDELNAQLAPHGLHFAPDVATGSRATIGGMIANNACGARSIIHGRTVDHVASVTAVMSDGEIVTFGADESEVHCDRAKKIEAGLRRIRDGSYEEIARRFPKILRSNGGYGLDRLGPPGAQVDVVKVLCGSEGTLGIVVRASLRLVPIPKHSGLLVLHYEQMLDALETTSAILRHQPSAVELVDRMILEAGRDHPGMRRRCGFLRGDPGALLIVEFQDDDEERLVTRMDALRSDASATVNAYATLSVVERSLQAEVWDLRRAGLGLLMSRPGDVQPIAFVEDSAVDPEKLHEYIERFSSLLDREGVCASYYAHASVGCIHVRPVINLKRADDIERMRRIADAVSDLALQFGGTMTGEHGDGLVRSCWLEKMYGPKILAAFREVKQLFDPDNSLNPRKIVDPLPMTEHLRFGPAHRSQAVKTHLDFTAHGGMAELAGMCSGVGQCRQRLVGAMCPSFAATGDERDTTRARANALRVALSDRSLLTGLGDPAIDAVMDLCIACKACRSECPTGVDMARLKTEYLSHRNIQRGVGKRARFAAELPHRLGVASRVPRLVNLIGRSKPARALFEHLYGWDRRIAPPRLATMTFRRWFDRHQRRQTDRTSNGDVVYFVDTWTNYFAPQVGVAAVTLLERAGLTVHCPKTMCCGRPAISQGLLGEATQLARTNVHRLARFAGMGTPIVGTEPSCVSALMDEYPQLLGTGAARLVAARTMMIETFLARRLEENETAMTFRQGGFELRYHAHCHQKAIIGSADAVSLIRHVWGDRGSEINSGCCGMAGTFGHEVEHYDIARAIGEQRLFPAVRSRGEARVAVSGISCRQHISHHTEVTPRHLVEYLADALE